MGKGLRNFVLATTIGSGLVQSPETPAQDCPAPTQTREITDGEREAISALITELDHPNYFRREHAQKQLEERMIRDVRERQIRHPLGTLLSPGPDHTLEQHFRMQQAAHRLAGHELFVPSRFEDTGEWTRLAPRVTPRAIIETLRSQGHHIAMEPLDLLSSGSMDIPANGTTYWKVIREICQETGTRARVEEDRTYPRGHVLRFRELPETAPHAISGPLRVFIDSAQIARESIEGNKKTIQFDLVFEAEERLSIGALHVDPGSIVWNAGTGNTIAIISEQDPQAIRGVSVDPRDNVARQTIFVTLPQDADTNTASLNFSVTCVLAGKRMRTTWKGHDEVMFEHPLCTWISSTRSLEDERGWGWNVGMHMMDSQLGPTKLYIASSIPERAFGLNALQRLTTCKITDKNGNEEFPAEINHFDGSTDTSPYTAWRFPSEPAELTIEMPSVVMEESLPFAIRTAAER